MASISLTLYCANYTYTGATVTTSGSNITIQLDYTVGAICQGAFQYPTVNVNLGQLQSGPVTITAQAYLNSTFSSASAPINTTVISCCGAVASFTPSEDTICVGDTVNFANSTINQDSVKWYKDWVLQDTIWSPTWTFDSAGSFEVELVAFADTCNDTATQTIVVNSLPNIDLGPDTTLCEGVSMLFSVSSSLSNIMWSNGSNSSNIYASTTGTYWVSGVNNNGCLGTDTVDITAILPITDVDLGGDLEICPGTSATLSGQSGLVNHMWSTGATTPTINTSFLGLYWLEANAPGECPGRDSIMVSEHTISPLTIIDEVDKCGSNNISTTVSYASYIWSTGSTAPSETFTDSTTAFLTVTDGNGCVQSDSFEVIVWEIPPVDLGPDTHYCPGASLVLSSNVSGTYLWSTGSTGSGIGIIEIGEYWLEVTNEQGCVGRDSIVIGVCVGMNDVSSSELVIYPNPTSDIVHLTLDGGVIKTYTLFSAHGQILMGANPMDRSAILDVQNLPFGVYTLLIEDDEGRKIQEKLLID